MTEAVLIPPASLLAGMELDNGWKVISAVEDFDGKSGGTFSYGYLVERDDEKAFLKAFDYVEALQSDNPAEAIKPLINMYEFERILHDQCVRLNRVIRILEYGSAKVPDLPPIVNVVQYLIFERADGDLNWALGNFDVKTASQILLMAHHAAVGLWQLHRSGISHQDLKPSNLMVFNSGRHSAKVGDLGSACQKGVESPRSIFPFAGDRRYAPPERLYGYDYKGEWVIGRVAGDMYLLGSLIFSMFAGSPLSATIIAQLPEEKHPLKWRGTYAEITPDLVAQFDLILDKLSGQLPDIIAHDLPMLLQELACPDVTRRGNIRNQRQQYSLEIYISRLDRLSKVARLDIERVA